MQPVQILPPDHNKAFYNATQITHQCQAKKPMFPDFSTFHSLKRQIKKARIGGNQSKNAEAVLLNTLLISLLLTCII